VVFASTHMGRMPVPRFADSIAGPFAQPEARAAVSIHPLAVVSPDAQLGRDVTVGPFCVVEAGATIGEGCQLASHVVVKQGTRLGAKNRVGEGAVLGGLPQHIRCPERCGALEIGADNTIREYATVHRALHEGTATRVGDGCLIMIGVHLAHDCQIGNHVIMANGAMLAGHVTVEDRAYLSGAVAVHQFCRIGAYAMVGGQAHVVKDVPPYVTVDGGSSFVVGLNLVGLRRNGFTNEQIAQLKQAYRLIYRSGLKWTEVLARLAEEFPSGPAARYREFFSAGTRGFTPERRAPPEPATIKLPEVAPPLTAEPELKAKAG
jgi:UDP-N-acetylglucosamine acyltransferase